jgi:hypothetical protein
MTGVLYTLITLLTLQNGIDIDALVTRYIATAEQYQKTFQNLTAEETKTLELYRAKNGQPSFALAERVTFSYSAFKRFNVATEEKGQGLSVT